MGYYIFILYLISYSTGFASLTLLILLYIRHKTGSILYYIIYLIVFTGTLVLNNIEFYRVSILFKYDTYSSIWVILLYNFLFGIMFYIVPLYNHKFLNVKFKTAHNLIFGALFLFSIIMAFIPYLYEGIRRGQAMIFSFKITVFIAIAIILYCIILSISSLGKISSEVKKAVIRFFLIYNALYFLVLLFEYYWNFNFQNRIRPISFGNLFYFVLNLITVIFISRNFFLLQAKVALDDIPDGVLRQYNLRP